MIWLARYWKPLAVVLLLGLVYLWGYRTGKQGAELDCTTAIIKAQIVKSIEINAANARVDAMNDALQAELRKPKSGPVIREVIRANPSDCVLAKPVADSVRDAVRRANEAAR